jgi:thymidine kinase
MTMTDSVIVQRQSELVSKIQSSLPEFVKACAAAADMVLLHQDAFAAAYQEDEYVLLGMAVKYAGMCGKEVRVIGATGQTAVGAYQR